MANTSSDGSAPAGHGGKQVSTPTQGGQAAINDKQRNADLAERNRQGNVARAQVAARNSRVKAAARGHIGPLK